MGCWKVRWHKNVTVEIIQLIDCFCILHRLHDVNYEWPTFSLVWSTKRAYDWCPGTKLLAIFLVWLSSENKLLLFIRLWTCGILKWMGPNCAQNTCSVPVNFFSRLLTIWLYETDSQQFHRFVSNCCLNDLFQKYFIGLYHLVTEISTSAKEPTLFILFTKTVLRILGVFLLNNIHYHYKIFVRNDRELIVTFYLTDWPSEDMSPILNALYWNTF